MAESEAEKQLASQVLAREGRNKHYNWAMFMCVFITCVALLVGGLITYVKIDQKASDTQKVVLTIRSSQEADTKTSICVALTTNNAVNDVILALVDKDPNKADYKPLTLCKIPTQPKGKS